MKGRVAELTRRTKETDVRVKLNLDGKGECRIACGLPFLEHMLNAMGFHGGIDMEIAAEGDSIADRHHLVEDIGIVLGQAIREAWSDASGIARFGDAIVPMDESCALVALDLSGRGYLVFKGSFVSQQLNGIPREMIEHFFYSLCINGGINAHIASRGMNDHHRCEAIFKAFGIALSRALMKKGGRKVPSTKGTIG